jgi:hypothetical protein
MTDEYGQVRPGSESYERDITMLRDWLAGNRPVYVEHAEHMTSHRLLIVPGGSVLFFTPPWGTKKYTPQSLAFFYEGHAGPVIAQTDGSDWVHWSYAAEKFGIQQYRGDALSLANFINRILGWGEDKMQSLGQ